MRSGFIWLSRWTISFPNLGLLLTCKGILRFVKTRPYLHFSPFNPVGIVRCFISPCTLNGFLFNLLFSLPPIAALFEKVLPPFVHIAKWISVCRKFCTLTLLIFFLWSAFSSYKAYICPYIRTYSVIWHYWHASLYLRADEVIGRRQIDVYLSIWENTGRFA